MGLSRSETAVQADREVTRRVMQTALFIKEKTSLF
jgi:hypothetical protein